MAPTLHMTVGLPASGKSTHAHAMVAESGGTLREVSRDTLRQRPDAPTTVSKRERWARTERDRIIAEALSSGASIVVHDTNLVPSTRAHLRRLAATHGADVQVHDFTHVPLQECLRRDALREARVGEDVIWRMWQEHLYTPATSRPSERLADAVIVDIDGTLARHVSRSPYDLSKVDQDEPIPHVVELVRDLASTGTQIIYASGREDSCRDATQQWLDEHVAVAGPLFMRAAGDRRKDALVKEEIFHTHIEGRWRIRFVLDDRDQVVFTWRTLGVPCLQVDYGRF